MLMGLPDRWNACSRTIPVKDEPSAFAYWGDTIAVGLESNVVLLDAVTGSRKSSLSRKPILSDHADTILSPVDVILSLAFSLDGTLLVSGSENKTVELWDVQTGVVVETFKKQTSAVLAVSISRDKATIASGTQEGTIYLLNVRTGECRQIVACHKDVITAICFSPLNPRHLISSSMDGTVQQWDLDSSPQVETFSQKLATVVRVAYSPNGTRFVSCGGTVATVRDSKFGTEVVKLVAPKQSSPLQYCCFSLDGRFVACAASDTIYVWDIADSKVRLVGNLVGHSKPVISIFFSSSLISLSLDRSAKFWQSSSFLTDSISTDTTPAQLNSTSIESVHLFVEDDTAVISDSSGMVKTWSLTTGEFKSSFPTPAHGIQAVHSAGDTLFVVWRAQVSGGEEYHVWDVRKHQFRTVPSSLHKLLDLRISGDGSKVFGLDDEHIEARSIQTEEDASLVKHKSVEPWRDALVVRGSKVWLASSRDVGWDFGGPKVDTFPLSRELSDRPRLGFECKGVGANSAHIKDTVTGRPVFHIPERYINTDMKRQWDGRYLVFWSPSGEVVIMDFNRVCPR